MNFIFAILLPCSFLLTLPLAAEDVGITNKLKSIDKEIELLENYKDFYQKKAYEEEMDAQKYRLEDWWKFTKDIEGVSAIEKKIIETNQRLEQLRNQKQQLLQYQKK